jgi:hypothetical protein
MQRTIGGLSVLVVLAGVCVVARTGVGGEPTTRPAAVLLTVAQDEASVEQAIAAYLKQKDGLEGAVKAFRGNEKDLYLSYELKGDTAPKFTLVIDTEVTGGVKEKVQSRAVRLYGYFELPASAKTAEARRKILELNNAWCQDMWVPNRIYLDKDGDVCLETYINIPDAQHGIHPEEVRDAFHRTRNILDRYYQRLSETVSLAAPTTKEE